MHIRDLVTVAEQQREQARLAATADHQALLNMLGQIVQDPGVTVDQAHVEGRLRIAYDAHLAHLDGRLASVRNAVSFVDQPAPAGEIAPHRSGLS